MTLEEFSDRFDVMVNSYSVKSIAGDLTFDEYEKSVFLSKAQDDMIISLYNGKNGYADSYESSEEIRRYLANLVVSTYKTPITNSNDIPLGVGSTSKFFTLPEDVWFIVYESVNVDNGKCGKNTTLRVYPVKHDEYQAIKDNPFRGANDRRALRLDLSEGNVEIVCKYNVTKYNIRYIKKVPPIILVDLTDGLSINEEMEMQGCVLHEALHERILDLAVRMALMSRGYNLNNNETKEK